MSAKSAKHKSILDFFHKKPASPLGPNVNGASPRAAVTLPLGSPKKKSVPHAAAAAQTLTPVPSSDAMVEDDEDVVAPARKKRSIFGLPSPVTPANASGDAASGSYTNSPSRKVSRPRYYHDHG